MDPTLPAAELASLLSPISARSAPTSGRRPIHVFYGGAQRFSRDVPTKMGALAVAMLDEHTPDAETLAREFGLDPVEGARDRLHARVRDKLLREPIEDHRVDFEDGFGQRRDDDEDEHAVRAGRELAALYASAAPPPFTGLRIKDLERDDSRWRALRTLDLFLTAFIDARADNRDVTSAPLVVTLPKVESERAVQELAHVLRALERALGLPEGWARVELMVESPGALLTADGRLRLGGLVDAGEGRVTSLHLGTYDLTAALSITAPYQTSDHPLVERARELMVLAGARAGVDVVDGACHEMPIGPHRAAPDAPLTAGQRAENTVFVTRALARHARSITHALSLGLYRGWDLHPGQLIARYAVTFAFFRRDLDSQAERLRAFIERAAIGDRVGAHFDDHASAQGLLHTFLRGHACGALDDDDLTRAGVTPAIRQAGSFAPLFATTTS